MSEKLEPQKHLQMMVASSPDAQSDHVEVWHGLEDNIRESLAGMVADRYPWESEQPRDKITENMLAAEGRFFSGVLNAVREAAAEHDQITVLFDVDETIGSVVFRNDKPVTILRPSLKPLLDLLTSQYNCRIGLLTGRGAFDNLSDIMSYIDPALIFSTSDYGMSLDSGITDRVEALRSSFGGENSIIDPALISTDRREVPSDGSGDIQKLKFLQDHRRDMPRTIVVVDDLLYPNFLNRKVGLYGVSLHPKPGIAGTHAWFAL